MPDKQGQVELSGAALLIGSLLLIANFGLLAITLLGLNLFVQYREVGIIDFVILIAAIVPLLYKAKTYGDVDVRLLFSRGIFRVFPPWFIIVGITVLALILTNGAMLVRTTILHGEPTATEFGYVLKGDGPTTKAYDDYYDLLSARVLLSFAMLVSLVPISTAIRRDRGEARSQGT